MENKINYPSASPLEVQYETDDLGLARFEGKNLKHFRDTFTTKDLKEVTTIAKKLIAQRFPTLHQEEDELVQETLKNLVNYGLEHYTPEKGEFQGYLYSIMRNTAIKILKKHCDKTPIIQADTHDEYSLNSALSMGLSRTETLSVPEQLERKEWLAFEDSLRQIALPKTRASAIQEESVSADEVNGFIWSRFAKLPTGEKETVIIKQAAQLSGSGLPTLELIKEAIMAGLKELSLHERKLLLDAAVNHVPLTDLAKQTTAPTENPYVLVKTQLFRARKKVLVKAAQCLQARDARGSQEPLNID